MDELTELALKAGGGNEAALDALCRREMPEVLRYVRSRGITDDADDVAQEIMLHLVGCVGKFRGASMFKTWFSRIMSNKICDYYRERGRSREVVDEGLLSYLVGVAVYQGGLEEMELHDLFKRLPTPYRDMAERVFIYGEDIASMAEKDGLAYEGMRSRYRRAKVALARLMEKEGLI